MRKIILTLVLCIVNCALCTLHAATDTIFSEPLRSDWGTLYLQEQPYPNCPYDFMWNINASYGYAKCTANKSGSSLGASDCMINSMPIDISKGKKATLHFSHTTYDANYSLEKDYFLLKVSNSQTGYTLLDIDPWPTTKWGWVDCAIDITDFIDKDFRFMFEYKSTDAYAGTWQIRDVFITIETDDPVTPPVDPPVPCRYSELNGLKGDAIRDKLHDMISSHYILSYNEVRADNSLIDVVNDTVLDIYSDCAWLVYDYCTGANFDTEVECECYNREHALPKSFWGGSTYEPMYTDLHHIFPTDNATNTKRSAWAYGEPATVTWSNSLGSRLGTGGTYTANETVFEPADCYKGDIARVYFYMMTCYQNYSFSIGGKGYRMFTYDETNSRCMLTSAAKALLLKWHRNDPVSKKEIDRNNLIEVRQGNRNPFIDEPDLVEYIWGNRTNQCFSCGGTTDINELGSEHAVSYIKTIIDGQLVIEVDGVRYTALGQRIK